MTYNYAARALRRRFRDNRTRLFHRQIAAAERPCPLCQAPYEAQKWGQR